MLIPNHGINCACMDQYIREIRRLTKDKSSVAKGQNRIDYVLRMAVGNRF